MLTISAQQFSALAAPAETRLLAWHRERLLQRFGDPQALTGRPVASLIEGVRTDAHARGIHQEQDIATLLDCAVMYGADFASHPWAAAILNPDTLPPSMRVELLRRVVAAGGAVL